MSKIRNILGTIVVLLAIAGIVWAVSNKPLPEGSEPIKIGLIGPLTGDAAVYGEPYLKTVQLAVDEINAAGGIEGHQVELIAEDGKCDGTAAVTAAQKLINVDNVRVIIGGVCSSETAPVVPIAEQGKVLLASSAASSPGLTDVSTYFFRDFPSDSFQSKLFADAAATQGWHTVAVISEQNEYTNGLSRAFKTNFESRRGSVIEEAFSTGTTDFRSSLIKLKSQNPDALFVNTQTIASAERIFKQLQELDWNPQLIINDATSADSATIKNNAQFLEGALTAEFLADGSNPKFQDFREAYMAKYGEEAPSAGYMATTYDMTQLVFEGIGEVGYDGTKLAKWSRMIKDWPGASGLITIGKDGDRASGHLLQIIRNGVKETVR